jgi:hypothetical protein
MKNARMVVETTNMRTASTLAPGLTKCPIYRSVRSPRCTTLTSISIPPLRLHVAVLNYTQGQTDIKDYQARHVILPGVYETS